MPVVASTWAGDRLAPRQAVAEHDRFAGEDDGRAIEVELGAGRAHPVAEGVGHIVDPPALDDPAGRNDWARRSSRAAHRAGAAARGRPIFPGWRARPACAAPPRPPRRRRSRRAKRTGWRPAAPCPSPPRTRAPPAAARTGAGPVRAAASSARSAWISPIWKARDQAKLGRKWRSAQPGPAASGERDQNEAGEPDGKVCGPASRPALAGLPPPCSANRRSIFDACVAQAGAAMGVGGRRPARAAAAALCRGRGRRRPRPGPRRRADRRSAAAQALSAPRRRRARHADIFRRARLELLRAHPPAGDAGCRRATGWRPASAASTTSRSRTATTARCSPSSIFPKRAAARDFAVYRDAVGGDEATRAVFQRILRDEEFHMNYTRAELARVSPERQGGCSGRRACRRLWKAYLRFAVALAGLFGTILLTCNISSCCRPSPGSRSGPRGASPQGWVELVAASRARPAAGNIDEDPRHLRPLSRLRRGVARRRPAGRGGAGGDGCRGARTTPPSRSRPSNIASTKPGSSPRSSTPWCSTSGRCSSSTGC